MTRAGIRPASALSLGIGDPSVSRAVRQLEDRVNALVRQSVEEEAKSAVPPSRSPSHVDTSFVFKEEDSFYTGPFNGGIPVKAGIDEPTKLSFNLLAGSRYHFNSTVVISGNAANLDPPVVYLRVDGVNAVDDPARGFYTDVASFVSNTLPGPGTLYTESNAQAFAPPFPPFATDVIFMIRHFAVLAPSLDTTVTMKIAVSGLAGVNNYVVYRGSCVELNRHVA